MIRAIAVLLFVIFGVAYANAGTVTITVSTASGTCSTPCTKTYTDTDANLAKIITAYQAGCNASISGICTGPQVILFWSNSLMAATVATVTSNDKNNLINSAVSGYTPINPQ